MNILIVTSFYTPHISGLTLYVEKLVEVLVELGHEITVLTNQHDLSLRAIEKKKSVSIIRSKVNFFLSKAPVSFSLIKTLLIELPKHDLVIANLPSLESPVIGILSKIYKKNLVSIHHCDPVVPGKLGFLFTQLAFISSLICAIFSRNVVTYTQDYALSSKLLKITRKKVKAILPWVKKGLVDQITKRDLKKKIGKSKYIIGFAGRISKDKGIEFLLKACAYLESSLKDYKIVLAGPTNPIGENYIEEIKPLVEKYSHRVVFLGSIPPSKMGSFYSLIDILVLPSVNFTESFGMVQVEALLQGVPLVTSDIPGVRQTVLLTGGGVLSNPADPKDIAAKIVTVLKSKKTFTAKQLHNFSKNNFKSNYNSIINLYAN